MFVQSVLFGGVVFMLQAGPTHQDVGEPHPTWNPDYVGSKPAKAYNFPWMVSMVLELAGSRELFGSGAILSPNYVMCSMDSFIRNSELSKKLGPARPFYLDLRNVVLFSGGVWGTGPIAQGPINPNRPVWFERRRVKILYMYSDPNMARATIEEFTASVMPGEINDFIRSPFGFAMNICLIEVEREAGNSKDGFELKRTTLPVPLFDTHFQRARYEISQAIANMEKMEVTDIRQLCWVGGWRLYDLRLVKRHVVYVPFDECRTIYCDYDRTTCGVWPLNHTHVCFKSLTFDDMCWADQGSALYCKWALDSVIAVLTSAPSCGQFGLPGVYTLIYHAMLLMDKKDASKFGYASVNKNKYTPPPEEELFPAYR